jgi:hypothetical protein
MPFQRCDSPECIASEVAEELIVDALRKLILPLESIFGTSRGWIRVSFAEFCAAKVLVTM